jgi:hypothetical protein
MDGDKFRSYRHRDPVAREAPEQTSRGEIGDLLVELARLTGQGDPYCDGGSDDGSFQAREDDTSYEQRQRGEDRYVAGWRRQPSAVPREHGKQKKPPSNRHFSRPAAKFNGFPGEASDHPAAVNKLQYSDAGQQTSPGRKDRQPVLPRPRAPTFFPTVSDDRHDGEPQSAETDETHGAYSVYDGLPSPRWRLVMMLGVLSLTGLGVVSAFPYRAVFGGWAVLPTLPPLVSADNGPKEIVPNYGDARPSSQTSTVSAGSTEKFVSRWPADNQEPPKTALISSDPSILRPAVPIARAASAPPPDVAPPPVHSSEPKKIHTVIIRSDGSEQTDTSAPAVAHSPTSVRAPGTR